MRAVIELKRVELWSLFKIAFVLYSALGLFMGVLYGFFMLVAGGLQGAFLGDEFPEIGIIGGVLGIFLIPVIAIFYGAMGSVFVTVGGFIFNLIVRMVGGLRIETDVVTMSQPAEVSQSVTPPDTTAPPI